MIGTIAIKCFAAKPQMPLPPVFAFRASPSSLRILDVPRKIGDWQITAVKVAVSYPDNSIAVSHAVRTGNVWVATFTGCGVSGKTANGIQILADGTDENGDPVEGYVLGCGDLYILDRDSSIAADDEKWYVRYCEELPATPATGDLIIDNGSVKMFDGEEWIVIAADLSAYATKEELNTAIQGVRQSIPTATSQLTNDSGFVDSAALSRALAEKQNVLTSAQVSAIDAAVNERKTIVTYADGSSLAFDVEGTFPPGLPNPANAVSIKIGTACTAIGEGAFYGCTALSRVTIPESVKSIGNSAFYQCAALTSLEDCKGVTTIGNAAFGGCTSLTKMEIPYSVTSLGVMCFLGCSSLARVTIPASVKTIGVNSFADCAALAEVTFLDRSLSDVQALSSYPWGTAAAKIKTCNDASQEWVSENYVKTRIMTQSEYDAITPDPATMYVIVAE